MSVIHPRTGRARRWVPAGLAAVVSFAAVTAAGSGSAGAAGNPQAQSVGNFLDAAAAGQPLDQVVKLEYAHAKSPGAQSAQNPLHATLLGQVELPLTGALQFPTTAGAQAGVLNQVAVAKPNGHAYGASGAVLNSGGISIGGDNGAYPSVASVDLCASALSGDTCGKSPADAIGELKLDVGAVAGLAQTPKGFGKKGTTQYGIAGVDLDMTSPLLADLLKQVDAGLKTVVDGVTTALGQAAPFPAACQLGYDSTTSFDGGAVTLNGGTGALTFHLAKLVEILAGKDINSLPANTDLLAYLLKYLANPDGLATGIQDFLDGITSTLQDRFKACADALDNPTVRQVQGLLDTLTTQLNTGKTTVSGAIEQALSGLGGADSSTLLDPLASALKNLVDIGVNVQPNGPGGDFRTGLDATPKQGTDVIAGQTIVRAIEIDLFNATGLQTPAGKAKARKSADPGLAIALGNAAAGPGVAPPTVVTSAPAQPSTPNPAQIPTGIPAGQAETGGAPAVPLTLVVAALIFAAGGVTAFRLRGRLNKH